MATEDKTTPESYAPATLLAGMADADLVEFCDDCIKYLKGIKVAFLSKYRDRFPNGTALDILPSRDYVLDVFQKSLRSTQAQTPLDQFKQTVTESVQEGELPIPETVTTIAFARRQEVAACMTQMVFRQTSECVLLDYNYNIETVMASDTYSRVNECFLTLELLLKYQDCGEGSEQIRRVVLEMNKDETAAFVHKLTNIEKEVVTASNV